MKILKRLLPGLLAVAVFGIVGCNKQNSVDTAPIENSFQSAEPATKSAADNVVSSIKSGDYSGALTGLQTLAKDAKLTPEQQQAIKDVMAQVQQAISSAASNAADKANDAAKDLQKSLPK